MKDKQDKLVGEKTPFEATLTTYTDENGVLIGYVKFKDWRFNRQRGKLPWFTISTDNVRDTLVRAEMLWEDLANMASRAAMLLESRPASPESPADESSDQQSRTAPEAGSE